MYQEPVDYKPRWQRLADALASAGYDATLTPAKTFGIDTYSIRVDREDVGAVQVSDSFDKKQWRGYLTTLRDCTGDVLASRFSGMVRDNVVADVARYAGVLEAVSQA